MTKSIEKNYLYNLFYQILTLITPLVTMPYLSRVLEADGIGIYSYTTSIVSYFMIFASLGIADCGQREIAYYKDQPDKQSRIFFEMAFFRGVTTCISLFLYYFFVCQTFENKTIYWIQSINIIALAFDISWFFQGLEEFKKIVLRNTIVRILNIFSIFLFVKSADDLPIYIFLMATMSVLANLSMWLYLPKYLRAFDRTDFHPFRYVRATIELFLPQIAIQIYTVLDKTMIGIFTGSAFENGYYEQAEKVVKLTLTLVTSLGTVMMPKIAYAFTEKNWKDLNEYMMYSFRFVWFLGVPLMFGLMAIADNFVPWFFGAGYEKVIDLIRIFSLLILFIGMSNVIGLQFFIPTKQQNLLTLTVSVGAIINFGLNLWLIPRYMSAGAVLSSVIAEAIVTMVMFALIRKQFSIKQILNFGYIYFGYGVVMFSVVYFIGMYLAPTIYNTFFLSAIGIFVYSFLLYKKKDKFFFSILNKIKRQIS